MEIACRIELLGNLQIIHGSHIVAHFGRKGIALMVGYLAYFLGQSYAREHLIDVLWPEKELVEGGRDQLSTTISAARKLLEPVGVQPGSILITDRNTVQLKATLITTDVGEFESLLKHSQQKAEPAERVPLLEQAVKLYKGEILKGLYAEWLDPERIYCEQRCLNALRQLCTDLEEMNDFEEALPYAQRMVALDPFCEEGYQVQMRLFAALNRTREMRRVYDRLNRRLRHEFGTQPNQSTRELFERLSHNQTEASTSIPHMTSSKTSVVGTLPVARTSFVGRQQEVQRLYLWLAQRKSLITLLGPGGVGKTRLAVEVVSHAARKFGWNVCFVSLAEVSSASLLPFAIAQAMGISSAGSTDILGTIKATLKGIPFLLVLDNMEHLLVPAESEVTMTPTKEHDGAFLVRDLLDSLPSLCCLVTSRQPLELSGEQQFPLNPFSTPQHREELHRLKNYASIDLFECRARLVQPEFSVGEDNVDTVAAICRKLEGMPLAIEMAAAWSGAYSLAGLLARIEQQTSSLTSPHKDMPLRHKDLRHTYAWSLDLLEADQRTFLAYLSVFRGGWTREAAEAVSGRTDVASMLNALLKRSLVVSEVTTDEPENRLHLLEPIRELAEGLLNTQEMAAVIERHQTFYLRLAEQFYQNREGPDTAEWLQRLERDFGNVQFCLERALVDNRGEIALRLCCALQPFYWKRGYLREGRICSAKALSQTGTEMPESLRANVLFGSGVLAMLQGDYRAAKELFEVCLKIRKVQHDEKGIGAVLNSLGSIARHQGNFREAQALFERSLGHLRAVGDIHSVRKCLGNLGNVYYALCEFDVACRLLQESLDLDREAEDEYDISLSLNNLARAYKAKGEYAQARRLYEESLIIARKLGDKQSIGRILTNLGNILEETEKFPMARMLHEQALDIFQQLQNMEHICTAWNNLGNVAQREGKLEVALALFRNSLKGYRELGNLTGVSIALGNLGHLACTMQNLTDAYNYLRECFSVSTQIEDKIGILTALEGFARIGAGANVPNAATTRLIGSAAQMRNALGISQPPSDQEVFDKELARLTSALGEEVFSQCYSEGLAMKPEKAAEYAAHVFLTFIQVQ